jgi:DNA-binding NarL/FixJ family response regulator
VLQDGLATGVFNAASANDTATRIAILSDTSFICEVFAEKCIDSHGLVVLDVASTVAAVISRILPLRPDALIIDAALPLALDAVRQIAPQAPDVRIIAFALPEHGTDIVLWSEAGMSGYIPRSTTFNELPVVIKSILRDSKIRSPRVAGNTFRRLADAKSIQRQQDATLTRREAEVVALIGEGLSNKEIARRLGIGLGTTKTHVHNVLRKMGIKQRGQLALYSYTALCSIENNYV